MADSADDRGGHATTSARRERVDSVRPFRFELRLSHNPWRVVPAPTDGRAARRRPARAASNAPARHAGHQAILEGARPSNLRAHSAPSRTRARTRHPRNPRNPKSPAPTPSPSPAQSPHLRAKSASPPTDDDNKGFGDDDSPRWANVGRWRHHSKLAPFFKRPKEIQQRLSERGRKMLRATVTGDPTGAMRVRDYVKMPRTIQTIDKVSFTLGVVGLMVTQFVATEHPRRFWAYYALTAPPIFAYRVIQYSMIKYHYFLIDFCYYANVACFVQILALPGSPALFRSVFAYANGPILMAIPLWRNSPCSTHTIRCSRCTSTASPPS